MLVLLPIAGYVLIEERKKDVFSFLIVIFAIAFILLLLTGKMLNKISIYYTMKNYFVLWILLWYCNYRGYILISKKVNKFPNIFLGAYIVFMLICSTNSNIRLQYWINSNPEESLISVMQIFETNASLLNRQVDAITKDEITLLKYCKDNYLNDETEIDVVADETGYYWQYVFMGYMNRKEYNQIFPVIGQKKLAILQYRINDRIDKVDYMIYFTRSKKYEELKSQLFTNAEIVYQNPAGGILKYKRSGL